MISIWRYTQIRGPNIPCPVDSFEVNLGAPWNHYNQSKAFAVHCQSRKVSSNIADIAFTNGLQPSCKKFHWWLLEIMLSRIRSWKWHVFCASPSLLDAGRTFFPKDLVDERNASAHKWSAEWTKDELQGSYIRFIIFLYLPLRCDNSSYLNHYKPCKNKKNKENNSVLTFLKSASRVEDISHPPLTDVWTSSWRTCHLGLPCGCQVIDDFQFEIQGNTLKGHELSRQKSLKFWRSQNATCKNGIKLAGHTHNHSVLQKPSTCQLGKSSTQRLKSWKSNRVWQRHLQDMFFFLKKNPAISINKNQEPTSVWKRSPSCAKAV